MLLEVCLYRRVCFLEKYGALLKWSPQHKIYILHGKGRSVPILFYRSRPSVFFPSVCMYILTQCIPRMVSCVYVYMVIVLYNECRTLFLSLSVCFLSRVHSLDRRKVGGWRVRVRVCVCVCGWVQDTGRVVSWDGMFSDGRR